MLRSVPLPHISSPPFTFSLLRIKSHNSCSAPDLEYYAGVTKPLGRCGKCQWQQARCGHPLNQEASLHLMLIVAVYPCLAVVQFFCFLDFASLRLEDASFLLDGTPNCFVGEAQQVGGWATEGKLDKSQEGKTLGFFLDGSLRFSKNQQQKAVVWSLFWFQQEKMKLEVGHKKIVHST